MTTYSRGAIELLTQRRKARKARKASLLNLLLGVLCAFAPLRWKLRPRLLMGYFFVTDLELQAFGQRRGYIEG